MRTFYIVVIGGMAVIFGMLLFPPLRFMTGTVDVSSLPALTQSLVAFWPYILLLFVLYAIHKLKQQ
jgi:hypothetical protein